MAGYPGGGGGRRGKRASRPRDDEDSEDSEEEEAPRGRMPQPARDKMPRPPSRAPPAIGFAAAAPKPPPVDRMPMPDWDGIGVGFDDFFNDDGDDDEGPGGFLGFEHLEKQIPYPADVYAPPIRSAPRRAHSVRKSAPPPDDDEDEDDDASSSKRVSFDPNIKPTSGILKRSSKGSSNRKASPKKSASSGSRGSRGSRVSRGSKGSAKKSGSRGSRGSSGSRGSKGSVKKSGSRGSRGSSGSRGSKGSAKKSGSRGSRGSTGAAKGASRGSRGAKSPSGAAEVRIPVRSGTVVAARDFNASTDAEALRKAMKGAGCDGKAVNEILCRRSNAQRQAIKGTYKQMFGRDLVKDLVGELHGHHEDVAVSLMFTPSQFDAMEIRRAVKGAGTMENILIEILASRSNAQIEAMKRDYGLMYKRDMVADIESDTSFHFKKLLRALLTARRDESGRVDRAAADARALYEAGEKRLGTDESRFNAVIAAQGFPQLQLVFEEYGKVSKRDLEAAIRKEFSGSIMNGLLAVVKCARHTPSFFAERLYLSVTVSVVVMYGNLLRVCGVNVQGQTYYQLARNTTMNNRNGVSEVFG